MDHRIRLPDDEFMRQNEAALEEAASAEGVEPRARTATYLHDLDLVLVLLQSGDAFGFPPSRLPGLRGASAERLGDIRISPSGDGLHWDTLDAHASLTGLIREGLRLRAWAPRILGGVRTEAKARAARANGRKGGRPKRERAR